MRNLLDKGHAEGKQDDPHDATHAPQFEAAITTTIILDAAGTLRARRRNA